MANVKRILLIKAEAELNHLAALLRGVGYYAQILDAYDPLPDDLETFSLVIFGPGISMLLGKNTLDVLEKRMISARVPLMRLDMTMHQADATATLNRVQQIVNRSRMARHLKTDEMAQVNLASEESEAPTVRVMRSSMDGELNQQMAVRKTLAALGRAISSVLDVNAVLNQVVEAGVKLTKADECMILLPDVTGEVLYMRAMKSLQPQDTGTFRVRNQDYAIAEVYRSGSPLIKGGEVQINTQHFARALMYVPLKHQNQVIGVLGVTNRLRETLFTPTDLEILTDLASYAAIAIQNASLYERQMQQNRQLQTLMQMGMAVNSTLALPDVLLSICRHIMNAFEADACFIERMDAEQSVLQPFASVWQSLWLSGNGYVSTSSNRTTLFHALDSNSYYVADRSRNTTRPESLRLSKRGATYMLMIPVRDINQAPFAALELYYRQHMPEADGQLRTTSRKLAAEIFDLLATNPPQDQAIWAKAEEVLKASGADWFILSVRNGTEALVRILKFGAAVYLEPPMAMPVLLTEDLHALLSDPKPSFITDHENLPQEIRARLSRFGAKSVVSIPLFVKDTLFGIISVYHLQGALQFQPHVADFASSLAAQAGIALENANLYNALQKSLSDLRNAQASLVQAARLSTMGQFAAVIAHQINNPLTTVIGDSYLLLQDLPPDTDAHESAQAILRAGERAHSVVKRLLGTARRAGPAEPDRYIEINQSIRNTLELITSYVERAGIELHIELDPADETYTYGPVGHLEDVWLNLLSNGRDVLLGRPAAMLSVRSVWQGKQGVVTISDNGPGIPRHIQDVLFEPFFTTKPEGEGTGLGLYVCKQVVNHFKGTITAQTYANQGTLFTVTLPLFTPSPDDKA
jgi:signal transduction histidine kinase